MRRSVKIIWIIPIVLFSFALGLFLGKQFNSMNGNTLTPLDVIPTELEVREFFVPI